MGGDEAGAVAGHAPVHGGVWAGGRGRSHDGREEVLCEWEVEWRFEVHKARLGDEKDIRDGSTLCTARKYSE